MKKIMKVIILMVIELLSFLFISCSSGNEQLKHIDQIMESNPQKALLDLDKIKKKELSSDDYPYYCLLYTQAQIKNGIVVSSDSLIKIPYEIFRRKKSGDLKKRVCFYNSKILYNQGCLGLAMRDALIAREIAKNEGSSYWIAKTAELMGDIFSAAYNYEESEVCTIEALENYKKSRLESNYRYALCDLATIYLNENRDREAIAIIDSLSNIVMREEPLDSALLDYIMMTKYSSLVKNDRFDELKDGIPLYIHAESNDEEIDISIMKSYLLNRDGQLDASLNLLMEASNYALDEKQNIRVMYALYQHALAINDYHKASLLADSLLLIQSNIAREMLKESVTGVQRDFYSSKAKQQEDKSKILYQILITVIAIAVVITVLLVVIYQLKIKAKKAELEVNISSLMSIKEDVKYVSKENERLNAELTDKSVVLEDLQKRLDDNTQKNIQNRTVIEYLFREKWGTLNMLCNEYFEMGESEVTRNAILVRIEKEIKKLSSKKNLRDIEIAVDLYMGNVVKMLREECSFLKEEDIVFISLIFAGLSVRAICMFTGMKYKHYYLKKSRLIKRISSSSVLHKEIFLKKMS